MKDQINKIIEENLPKQIGEVLQKRLQELEEKEKALAALQENHSHLMLLTDNQQLEIQRLNDIKEREQSILEQEREIKACQLKSEYEKKFDELKLQESEKRYEAVNSYTSLLLRNTTFRERLLESRDTLVSDGNGGSYSTPMNYNSYIEKTSE